jgi:hypothetical protein
LLFEQSKLWITLWLSPLQCDSFYPNKLLLPWCYLSWCDIKRHFCRGKIDKTTAFWIFCLQTFELYKSLFYKFTPLLRYFVMDMENWLHVVMLMIVLSCFSVVLGIEPKALHVLSKWSTTVLYSEAPGTWILCVGVGKMFNHSLYFQTLKLVATGITK